MTPPRAGTPFTIVTVCCLTILLGSVGAPRAAHGQGCNYVPPEGASRLAAGTWVAAHPEATGAEKIALIGATAMQALAGIIVGQGVPGTAPPDTVVAGGGRLVWRLVRQKTDNLGMTHTFYRQVLLPPPALIALLEPPYATEGVELFGGELGIHAEGETVRSVFGAQYRDLDLQNLPRVTSAAARSLAATAAFAPAQKQTPSAGTEAVVPTVPPASGASLLLVSAGDGRTLRFTWRVHATDAATLPVVVYLDADSGAVVELTSTLMTDGPCDTAASPVASAVGIPQLGGPNRSIWVTPDANSGFPRRQLFTHEAHRPVMGDGIPEIRVWEYMPSWYKQIDESLYSCGTNLLWNQLNCNALSWGVTPIKTVSSTPTYDDWLVGSVWENQSRPCQNYKLKIHGRAAGDAVWNTYQTMYTLAHDLNWFGFHGADAANLIINEPTNQFYKNSRFIPAGGLNWFDGSAVSFYQGQNESDPFVSSALDTVAHEWGHAVAHWNAMPYNTHMNQELHEGFADFLGYAVEWYRDSQNPDWTFQEDYIWPEGWKRRVDVPNPYGAFYWAELCEHDNCGTPHDPDEPHFRGNALGVVFRMLVEGVQNPGCTPYHGLCNLVPQQLGLQQATEILFRTLTEYVTEASSWWSLPDLAKAAAFDLYHDCSRQSCARLQQEAVETAFGALGYWGITGYHDCGVIECW